MSNIDVAKAALAAYSAGDGAGIRAVTTEDFTLSGPVPQPLNREQFVALAIGSTTAFPDWNFNARDYREVGTQVLITIQITGTHTGTLAIIPEVPPVPPTGSKITQPVEQLTLTMRDGKIAQLVVTAGPDGGVPGLYARVGHPLQHG